MIGAAPSALATSPRPFRLGASCLAAMVLLASLGCSGGATLPSSKDAPTAPASGAAAAPSTESPARGPAPRLLGSVRATFDATAGRLVFENEGGPSGGDLRPAAFGVRTGITGDVAAGSHDFAAYSSSGSLGFQRDGNCPRNSATPWPSGSVICSEINIRSGRGYLIRNVYLVLRNLSPDDVDLRAPYSDAVYTAHNGTLTPTLVERGVWWFGHIGRNETRQAVIVLGNTFKDFSAIFEIYGDNVNACTATPTTSESFDVGTEEDDNCDGIDGERDNGVFVDRARGSDTLCSAQANGVFSGTNVQAGAGSCGNGTIRRPYATLQAAIDYRGSLSNIVIANGNYDSEDAVVLPAGVNLRGGYRNDNGLITRPLGGQRADLRRTGSDESAPTALLTTGTGTSIVEGLFITSSALTLATGGSFYPVRNLGTSLVLREMEITALPGETGADGIDGANGANGGAGGNASGATPGAGGTSSCSSQGGAGGAGGAASADGAPGSNGSGGAAGGTGGVFGGAAQGVAGTAGTEGTAGTIGTANASSVVSFDSSGFLLGTGYALAGASGVAGTHGSGGGGGGGGANLGSGGGGGGAGGCGGGGGQGALGGGGSFGIVSVGGSLSFTSTVIDIEAGGSGGVGGRGGTRGSGGAAGDRGDTPMPRGGNGGAGRRGGHGGAGPGGNGGPAACVTLLSGASTSGTFDCYTSSPAPGGAGGNGRGTEPDGPSGNAGTVQDTLVP